MNETAEEPRMRIRDRDLRALVHAHGAAPGTDLHRVLAELQERRDQEQGEGGAERSPGGGRSLEAAPL